MISSSSREVCRSCSTEDLTAEENSSKRPVTRSSSAPVRIRSLEPRSPSSKPRAPSKSDFPAPVSPVQAQKPGCSSTRTSSMIARFCTNSSRIMRFSIAVRRRRREHGLRRGRGLDLVNQLCERSLLRVLLPAELLPGQKRHVEAQHVRRKSTDLHCQHDANVERCPEGQEDLARPAEDHVGF